MTFLSTLALAVVMITLAALPSASVALVVARSAALGVSNGAAVAAGIVLGDLIIVLLALQGLSALAESMGAFFAVLKFFGGGYLVWVGWSLIQAKPVSCLDARPARSASHWVSFASGILLTLGDVKAILFYASLLPSFVDLATVGRGDLLLITLITVVCVGGVKLTYAILARRVLGRWGSSTIPEKARPIAGGILAGTGAYLIVKS